MFQELLQKVGLSLNESRVYEALLLVGESNVNTLSVKSKVHRRNVYDSLHKLIEKGLASETFVKGEKLFKPTDPQRLSEIMKEQEVSLNKSLPAMKKLYDFVEPDAEAYMFRGIEGFKNYLHLILEQREPVYFIGAKALWLDPRLKYYLTHFDAERKKKGIKFFHLFDYEIKTEKPEILNLVGKPYKFLPKKYSSPTCVDVFGDYVVTFVGAKPGQLDDEPIQFVLKNKLLADGYRKFFQFMWDFCPEEK
ncbi:helix-turn-helix domain-containing protein [Candidatus Woesearchaeota archaeon]|nr:helix-turn-helix domain-containing protein [Candidatus Woesearchaeota archaeon]